MNNSQIKLAEIVSFLMFDGHLSKDLKSFYLSSKNKESLLYFKKNIWELYQKRGRFENGQGYGESYKYRIFSTQICKELENVGVPKGKKVAKSFLIPEWISTNQENSKAFLRIAFDCEGSIWYENRIRIRFGIFKTTFLKNNLILFIKQMQKMLNHLDIETTNYWETKIYTRQNNFNCQGVYFNIKEKSIRKYAKEIGFTDKFKKQRLSFYIKSYPQNGTV